MKKKYLDRSHWKRVIEKSVQSSYISNSKFKGYVSLVNIYKVTKPLIKNINNKNLKVCDDGYKWLQHMPIDENYALTTMINNEGKVVQWYFDITNKNMVDSNGNPYFEDLYLDIVVLPDGEVSLLDEDELIEAYKKGIITESQKNLAYKVANRLLEEIKANKNYLFSHGMEYIDFMKNL